MKTYPAATPYFSNLRADKAIYVDKTKFIVPLIAQQSTAHYLLIRPPRFGKSLFLSTLEQVFLGNQSLFKGLYIYDKIDWSQQYPIIRISLANIDFLGKGLELALEGMVQSIAAAYALSLQAATVGSRFDELLQKIAEQTQQKVVILIDDYDAPIIAHLENGHTKIAEKNRNILNDFLSVLKNSEDYVRFVFLTGSLMLMQDATFSSFNRVHNLTFDDAFATVCGFTEGEVRDYFAEELTLLAAVKGENSVAAMMEKIHFWHHGFSWNVADFVYAPMAIFHLLHHKNLMTYPMESDFSTFLTGFISENGDFDFTNVKAEKSIYHLQDLANLASVSLMLQGGYLTFKEKIDENIYKIGFPNRAIELTFSKMLLQSHLDLAMVQIEEIESQFIEAFVENDIQKALKIIADLFSTKPYEYFKERYWVGEEFFYAILFWIFRILSIKMDVSISIKDGTADIKVETDTHIYIFEFKKSRKATIILLQINSRKYAEYLASSKKETYLVAVAFNLRKRSISDWVMEKYKKR